MRNRPGYTLLELAIVLAITALCATAVAPPLLRSRDALAVSAARADLLAALATTRSAAILGGGASLSIDAHSGTARVHAADGSPVGPTRELAHQYGVTVETGRAAPVVIRFDALGIGRMANATMRLRRGRAAAVVSISAYGRVAS